ncbi:iron-sulfur cluster assembly scaffold protein [Candidatus Woesearchaeota archaeon]|nr:iron-sulfur cluster assembly scaffold protein [Candidatus Woesearchaeota archaeon]
MDYNEKVIKRFSKPKNVGEIKNADGIGKVGNPRCGDVMELFIKVKNNKIVDAKFRTFGCVAAIATSDALCDMVKGKTIEEAKKITNQDIVNDLGTLPPIKVHCSVLGREALDAAIKDYENKKN